MHGANFSHVSTPSTYLLSSHDNGAFLLLHFSRTHRWLDSELTLSAMALWQRTKAEWSGLWIGHGKKGSAGSVMWELVLDAWASRYYSWNGDVERSVSELNDVS